MPFVNEHSARLQDPKKFEPKSFRRNDSPVFGKKLPTGVEVIWGKLKGKSSPSDSPIPQAIRFPDDKYTEHQAKKWLADNNIKYILFETSRKETKESKFEVKIKEQEDDVLVKSLREVKAWFSELKKEDESEFTESEVIDVSKMIIREMIQRGKQKFHPENWKNEAIGLYTKTFNEIIMEGIDIPEKVMKFLPILQESKHSHDKCMEADCKNVPKYEMLWAEGKGHAWFCEKDFKAWLFKEKHLEDVDYVKEVKDGKASSKFSENKNSNIWEDLKKQFKHKEEFIEELPNYILRRKRNNENSEEVYEILIDSGKNVLDRLIITNNLLEKDESEVVRKTMNIETPNGKSFKEWMIWEGSIPPEEAKLTKTKIIDKAKDIQNAWIVGEPVKNEIVSQTTLARFKPGQEVWVDQWKNIYTGDKGGPVYGNLNKNLPVYIDIMDRGKVEIIEDSKQFTSFRFYGGKLFGYRVMRKEDPKSDVWILSIGEVSKRVREGIESNSTSIPEFKEVSISSSDLPIKYKFQESEYTLTATKNDKLILTKS